MSHKRSPLFLLMALLFALAPFITATKTAAPIQAQDENTLTLPGLEAPVTVIYDSIGIPHIYAETPHDLMMAQGYIHATDRFWQMDWWRRLSSGRRAELGGQSFFGFDRFIRTLNFQAAAERDLTVISDETKAALQAYADGVNAYIESRATTDLAIEYEILASRGIAVEVQPWDVTDTVRWYKVMALNLSGNFQDELFRAGITEAVGSLGANFLLPKYPFGLHPVITEPGGIDYSGMAGTSTTQALPEYGEFELARVAKVLADMEALQSSLVGPFGAGEGIGSNSWVIGPGKTDSGMTYLANDPHLGIQNPSIWYEVGLHCVELSTQCPYDVAGVSFAGSPGIIIGHTAHVAWGFTNVGTDVQDLYLLTINPDNPMQYMFDGEWVDFEVTTETIYIQGREPVEWTVFNSVWGPVISQAIGFEQTFALHWTAFEPSTVMDALLQINRAQNWDDFRTAAQSFDVPAQNMLYADTEGNIGYQMPGKTPIRAQGHTGKVPVDGSTSANAWQGYIPFDDLPMILNPDTDYIVTANNTVVNAQYPYYITDDWDYGYRAARIEMMIQNDADGIITLDEMKAMQGDNYNLKADFLIPALQGLSFDDAHLRQLVDWLAAWNRQNDVDSGEAALLETFWVSLLTKAFADDLGFVPDGGSLYWYLASQMIANPAHLVYGAIWDDNTTPDVKETADEILAAAFTEAVAAISETQGDDPAAWSWGHVHIAHFDHELFGNDTDLSATFNAQVATGGGNSIVNATGWSAGNANPFEVESLPSMRQLLIPQAWDSSLRANTFGQSGDPDSPHHHDQMEMWAAVEYHPDWFSRAAVEADAAAVWQLTP